MSAVRLASSILTVLIPCVFLQVGCGGPEQQSEPTTAESRVLTRTPGNAGEPDLPAATRQTVEGYWLSAQIGPNDVPLLRSLGVRAVLSAVSPREGTSEALERAGIAHFSVPMGDTFRHAETILQVAERYPPDTLLIHCQHGADRTGAIAAFLLVMRHGWQVSDALYSVVYPAAPDTDGLADVLWQFGFDDAREPTDPSVGFYSISGTGRAVGGMKVRNERYARLVITLLETILGLQPLAADS